MFHPDMPSPVSAARDDLMVDTVRGWGRPALCLPLAI